MNELEFNKVIGQKIKSIRKDRQLTLKDLGVLVGISESNTKRYEDGQIKKVSIWVIKKFADALHVDPAFLVGWKQEPSSSLASPQLSSIEKKILKEYRTLPAHDKEEVKEFVGFKFNKNRPKVEKDAAI